MADYKQAGLNAWDTIYSIEKKVSGKFREWFSTKYEILKEPRGWPDWAIKVSEEIIHIELKRKGDKIDRVRQYPIFKRLLKANKKYIS